MNFQGTIVFIDGEFKRYEDVHLGLMNHAFLYGTGCFEAMRGYRSLDGQELRILAAREHFERLMNSAKILRMNVQFTVAELVDAVSALVERNGYREDIYIRATLFKSGEQLGVRLHDLQDSLALVAIPYSGYYGAANRLHAGVSSWKRVDDNAAPARAKITGSYINSALAKTGAVDAGFDEAITLTDSGHVAEASVANIFLRRGRVLATPSINDNILEGITRRIVLELLRDDESLEVVERSIDRSELYIADEVFITGTAVGVTPICTIDHRPVGNGSIGPITTRLQQIFDGDLRGESPIIERYLAHVSIGGIVSR